MPPGEQQLRGHPSGDPPEAGPPGRAARGWLRPQGQLPVQGLAVRLPCDKNPQRVYLEGAREQAEGTSQAGASSALGCTASAH